MLIKKTIIASLSHDKVANVNDDNTSEIVARKNQELEVCASEIQNLRNNKTNYTDIIRNL